MTTGDHPEAIRADIEATREEMGETVEALAYKTDVKARAQDKVQETKAAAAEKADQLRDRAQEMLGQAKEATPDEAASAASQASQRVVETAREKPIHTAAIAAFVLGIMFGRLTKGGD